MGASFRQQIQACIDQSARDEASAEKRAHAAAGKLRGFVAPLRREYMRHTVQVGGVARGAGVRALRDTRAKYGM